MILRGYISFEVEACNWPGPYFDGILAYPFADGEGVGGGEYDNSYYNSWGNGWGCFLREAQEGWPYE